MPLLVVEPAADITPPQTALDPVVSPTSDSTPTFVFSSSEDGSTFECSIDGGAFLACVSPLTVPALADGPHHFAVRAIGKTSDADATPDSASFTIDSTAPQTTLDPVASPTADSTPTFVFSSDEPGSTFECSVDGGEFSSCSSPLTVQSLTDGLHQFAVRAIDQAGNADASPASASFTVDTTPPPPGDTGGTPGRQPAGPGSTTSQTSGGPAATATRLAASPAVLKVKSGAVKVVCAASAGKISSCRATLTVRGKTIATASGPAGNLKLKLNAAGRKLLRKARGRRLAAKLTLTARTPRGPVKATRNVKIQ